MKSAKSEIRDEIIYILDYLLTQAKLNSFSDTFTVPNGSEWRYDNVKEYVKNNLK